jgi:hypothetical protein
MFNDTVKYLRKFFQPTLLDKVIDEIAKSLKESKHCMLVVTPTDVYRQDPLPVANVALIAHEKIKEFQKELLAIELKVIELGHFCIIKLAEDKSYATLYIYIEELDTSHLN